MTAGVTIRRNGMAEMAYVGETPWWGGGNKLPVGAPLSRWREAAGMDWKIEAAPLSYEFGGKRIEISDRVALHRDDNGMPLGLASRDYQIVQPGEVIEFFSDLVKAVGFSMETAGTLFGGRRFWAMARVGEQALIGKKDKIRGYLLLCSSADGSLRTRGKITSVRVVCQNTLTAALNGSDETEVRISHRAKFVPDEVKRALGVAPKAFEDFMADMRRLADTKLKDEEAVDLTNELLGGEDTPNGQKILELFRGKAIGHDLPGFAGTPWGWLNSVTEFADHGRKAKSDSHRLSSALLGSADRMKSRARDMALEFAGAA